MKIIKGNLIELAGNFDAIAHGCNCFHTMGRGFALQIKKSFPSAFTSDKETQYGNRNKLGTFSVAHVGRLSIYNLYTQFRYGTDVRHFHYGAFVSSFNGMLVDMTLQVAGQPEPLRLGIPRIGCTLAGGDKVIVKEIIEYAEREYSNMNPGIEITIVEYKK